MDTTMTYTELANLWMRHKATEARATAARIAVEEQLLQFFDMPESGQRSRKEGGFQTTVTTGFNVKPADKEAFLNAIRAGVIPAELAQLQLHATGVLNLRKALPGSPEYQVFTEKVLPLVTIAPAKPNFNVVKVAG